MENAVSVMATVTDLTNGTYHERRKSNLNMMTQTMIKPLETTCEEIITITETGGCATLVQNTGTYKLFTNAYNKYFNSKEINQSVKRMQ